MARQQKTAQPKGKFVRPCLTCGTLPVRKVTGGVLVTTFGCGHTGAPSAGGK